MFICILSVIIGLIADIVYGVPRVQGWERLANAQDIAVYQLVCQQIFTRVSEKFTLTLKLSQLTIPPATTKGKTLPKSNCWNIHRQEWIWHKLRSTLRVVLQLSNSCRLLKFSKLSSKLETRHRIPPMHLAPPTGAYLWGIVFSQPTAATTGNTRVYPHNAVFHRLPANLQSSTQAFGNAIKHPP